MILSWIQSGTHVLSHEYLDAISVLELDLIGHSLLSVFIPI